MATSAENAGVLIVFESDGCKWASHFRTLLDSEPYNIPAHSEHWWNLNARSAMNYPVHVLVLTPLMKHQIQHEKLSCLRNDSITSLLLECNVDSQKIQMPEWRVIDTIDVSPDKQRNILTTLVEMFELATNDDGSFNSNDPVPIDIVPTCLYPGDRTIYIMLNEEPKDEVSIRLEGVPNRLTTKMHTKNTYTCELPDIEAGERNISVYSYYGYSLYTTKIVIVTAELLMKNFIENLSDTRGVRNKIPALKDWNTLYLNFNPFSEILCPENQLIYFARLIQDIMYKSHPIERDSGLSDDLDDPNYSIIPSFDFAQLPEVPACIDNTESKEKSKGFGRLFMKFIRPKSCPEHSYNISDNKRKYSRRSRIARSHNFTTVPELPPKHTIFYEKRCNDKR